MATITLRNGHVAWTLADVKANRAYADRLDRTADHYAHAALATGLEAQASEYLRSEARRLEAEASSWRRTCDTVEEEIDFRAHLTDESWTLYRTDDGKLAARRLTD